MIPKSLDGAEFKRNNPTSIYVLFSVLRDFDITLECLLAREDVLPLIR